MRLINTQTLELAEFFGGHVPRYAILSHTWGAEEVTFEEWACAFPSSQSSGFTIFTALQSVVGPQVLAEVKKKAGYRKVRDAAELALRNGRAWIWVDTCCINKSSSAELSESINSMFKWYGDAGVCYVYLADVDKMVPDLDASLASSKWFTRGWTLQELIAPYTVVFYDRTWNYIGDRDSLQGQITSITRIPAISKDLDEFSIAERMSWAANRSVTRGEDVAYCLLGIFGVNMPLLYGEGSSGAFRRLQIQIMETSDDSSLYAWNRPVGPRYRSWGDYPDYGLLAPHPNAFANSCVLRRYDWSYTAQMMHFSSSMVSAMVRMRVYLRRPRDEDFDVRRFEILLQCKVAEDLGDSSGNLSQGIKAVVLDIVHTGEFYIRSRPNWRVIHVVSQQGNVPKQATDGSIEEIDMDGIGEAMLDDTEEDDFRARMDASSLTREEFFLKRAFVSGFSIAEILISA